MLAVVVTAIVSFVAGSLCGLFAGLALAVFSRDEGRRNDVVNQRGSPAIGADHGTHQALVADDDGIGSERRVGVNRTRAT